MKVGILTFHASHNYGSMLQAYALQQTVLKLGHECEIINLRTSVQKNMYKPFYRQKGWVKKLKAIRYPKLAIDDARKHKLFEKFLEERLILTPVEYHTAEELKQAHLDFDAYISGSDQIWNTSCSDFLKTYFLDFVKSGKRIAYAPSMGPRPEQSSNNLDGFICESLFRYDFLSVREPEAAKRIKELSGIDIITVSDPTFLLSSKEWSALAGETPLIKGDYILLYTPWFESYKSLYEQASIIAKREKLMVVCTIPDAYNQWHRNKFFKPYVAVGPIEFLNLIKYSRYVLCGSFHAVAFSILLKKPFYAYDGMNDSRISHLLKNTGIETYTEFPSSVLKTENVFNAEDLNRFIGESYAFLKNALK